MLGVVGLVLLFGVTWLAVCIVPPVLLVRNEVLANTPLEMAVGCFFAGVFYIGAALIMEGAEKLTYGYIHGIDTGEITFRNAMKFHFLGGTLICWVLAIPLTAAGLVLMALDKWW